MNTNIEPSLSLNVVLPLALKVRAFELKLLSLFSEGHIRGTVHTCWGQELTPALVAHLLEPDDIVFGTHRGHGYFLGITKDFEGLAREILGKQGGVSRGVGGSQHLHSEQILTNGIQGGLVPVAAGAASTLKNGIAIAVIGDGTLGQGALYETLNIASLHALPILIILEDNSIAQTTPQEQTLAGSVANRFKAFDWEVFFAADSNPHALASQVSSALAYVRRARKPAVLHLQTRRLGPHSKGDDNRSKELIKELRETDSLNKMIESSAEISDMWASEKAAVDSLFAQVLTEPNETESSVSSDLESRLDSIDFLHDPFKATDKAIRRQVTTALRIALDSDLNCKLIGEDIVHLPPGMERPYKGAFGVSDDLSSTFPGRVVNFPISEQGITGFGIGRALKGEPTIVEIMFGDFTTLTIDQIRQQASKISGIYGQRIELPFLLRTPMGGRRGYGPTHSQSLEGMFFGIPGILVFSVSPFGVGTDLFHNILRLKTPTILCENKDLYGLEPRQEVTRPYMWELQSKARDPIKVSPKGRPPQVTVVSYGFAAELVLRSLRELASKQEIFIEVLVYEIVSPLDARPIAASLV